MDSFRERLKTLLVDRKQTPWGQSLGFASPTISSMFKGGRIPGPKLLTKICTAENINLNWLIVGTGPRYIVEHFMNTQSICEEVRKLLDSNEWTIFVCANNSNALLVTVSKELRETGMPTVRILWARGSEQLANTLITHKNRDDIQTPFLPDNLDIQIASGIYGTYQLVCSSNKILKNYRKSRDIDLMYSSTERGQYNPSGTEQSQVHIWLIRAVIKNVENYATEHSVDISVDQKSRIITAVYRQAVRLGLSADELTTDAVETAFDVLRD